MSNSLFKTRIKNVIESIEKNENTIIVLKGIPIKEVLPNEAVFLETITKNKLMYFFQEIIC